MEYLGDLSDYLGNKYPCPCTKKLFSVLSKFKVVIYFATSILQARDQAVGNWGVSGSSLLDHLLPYLLLCFLVVKGGQEEQEREGNWYLLVMADEKS
jgi:hypothetical protein